MTPDVLRSIFDLFVQGALPKQGFIRQEQVALAPDLVQEHRRRNGYVRDAPVEVLALRARATSPAPLDDGIMPCPGRSGE